MLLFPLIVAVDRWLRGFSDTTRLLSWFLLSLAIDFACLRLGMPGSIYRIFYGRFLFAVALGMHLCLASPPRILALAATGISVAYIAAIWYLQWIPSFVYPAWQAHKALVCFYTAMLVGALWYAPRPVRRIADPFLVVGRASFHIFLVQLTYFWRFERPIARLVEPPLARVVLAVVLCCTAGILFFQGEQWVRSHIPGHSSKV